ncbi:DUF4974 domain-containing protein [Fulvivirgaceae bacterium BMA12]|uniref:DUF4974 domain-containing protein n=1 Tax=Agaribacillus aureus TaxID=3051825 RepID=A0ABT8LEN2_9BACT|nr:DUF4974 domain-containing protein [Fulvivirgaceae bacterium BMA12]
MNTHEQEHIKKIVIKYLHGTCSRQELNRLHNWIVSDGNQQMLDELVGDLLTDSDLPLPQQMENREEAIWNQIYAKLKPQLNAEIPLSNHRNNDYRSTRIFSPGKIAAVIALLLTVGGMAWFFAGNNTETVLLVNSSNTWTEKKTKAGEKITIPLPDGSKVKLNSLSSLRYNTDFNVADRRLHLTGEGFFEVVANKQKPFVVVTGSIETTVLGTSFNVRSFSDSTATIAVASGNVLVKDRVGSNAITLVKNEMANVKLKNQVWRKSNFDYDKVIGWKDGILLFENERFEEILVRLERWYGVEFEVHGQADPDVLINTRYHNDPLERILKGLSFTYKFSFEIREKSVIIRFES